MEKTILTIDKLARDISEIPKSKPHDTAHIIEYVPGAIATQPIMYKITGNIRALAFDTGQSLTEKISRFDTFIQIIEGKAEIIINNKFYLLETAQCIIIPAHSYSRIKAKGKFKMLSSIIKSGYETVL